MTIRMESSETPADVVEALKVLDARLKTYGLKLLLTMSEGVDGSITVHGSNDEAFDLSRRIMNLLQDAGIVTEIPEAPVT